MVGSLLFVLCSKLKSHHRHCFPAWQLVVLQNPPWGGNGCAVSRAIPRHLWIPRVRCRVQKMRDSGSKHVCLILSNKICTKVKSNNKYAGVMITYRLKKGIQSCSETLYVSNLLEAEDSVLTFSYWTSRGRRFVQNLVITIRTIRVPYYGAVS
jgi:hypothetical protein